MFRKSYKNEDTRNKVINAIRSNKKEREGDVKGMRRSNKGRRSRMTKKGVCLGRNTCGLLEVRGAPGEKGRPINTQSRRNIPEHKS